MAISCHDTSVFLPLSAEGLPKKGRQCKVLQHWMKFQWEKSLCVLCFSVGCV